MPRNPKKIKINGAIIGDSNAFIYKWLGIQATWPKMIADELDNAEGDPVEFYINSPGGSVFAGSEIYTLIKEYKGETTSKITGVAASAASFVATASDKTLISPTGQIMIHNSSTGTEGDRHTHGSRTSMLTSVDEAISNAYSLKTGKSKEELMTLMDSETWLNAQKAVEMGFADEVMFSAEPEVTNSASSYVELPQEVIDKLRNELMKSGVLSSLIDNQQVNNIAPPQGEEGDEEIMNYDELKAKYPDIFAAVVAEGVTAERARITELNALANAPGAADIVAKAITEGTTAAQAAMDIVKASKSRIATEGAHRATDAAESNASAVPAGDPTPVKLTDDQEAQAHADGIVAEIQKLSGGKK